MNVSGDIGGIVHLGIEYRLMLLSINDDDFLDRLVSIYVFLKKYISIDELASIETFSRVMADGGYGMMAIAKNEFHLIGAKNHPYYILYVTDVSGRIVGALTGSMLVDAIRDDRKYVYMFLSYIAVDEAVRSIVLLKKMVSSVIDVYGALGFEVRGMVTELVPEAVKAAGYIYGLNGIYIGNKSEESRLVYMMPSQEYDVDGSPCVDVITSSWLLIGGKHFCGSISAFELKRIVCIVFDWIYKKDQEYFLKAQKAAGVSADYDKANKAMLRCSAYVDGVMGDMFFVDVNEYYLY